MTAHPPSTLRAALWMSGWLLLMLFVAIGGRETLRDLNVFQVMEIRSLFGFVFLTPIILLNGGFRTMATARPVAHVTRNLVHYASQLGWFYALTLIPLSQLVSIEFTMPIWIAIMAAIFLGERMTLLKIVAIVLGLIGVVVIVRPTAGEINVGQLVSLASAFGFGISITLIKSLTRTDSALKIIFWMIVVQSIAGIVPAIATWQWPSAYVWFWLVIVGFCGTFSHFCMARAMLYADATVVVPMDFLRVPLSAAIGWLLYSERLDMFTLLGAALILAGNTLNLRSPAPRPAAASS
ncbi:DMT family transporter [Tardiphaga sp.]|jgi:drug/metabolite transporter (DMT)-like permease|uniref:DMT family transporter n=1 Tax=Tardiphaga sp. TaxID=1926292 RepID=UPI0037D9B4FA